MSSPRFDSRDLIAIGIGGALGATLRWWISNLAATSSAGDGGWFTYAPSTSATLASAEFLFAWETLSVNVLGCLVLGAVTALALRSQGTNRALLALGTGFCGSLTTFSTFAVDVASALRGRALAASDVSAFAELAPHRASAMLYLILSVVLGATAFWFGRLAARRAGATS